VYVVKLLVLQVFYAFLRAGLQNHYHAEFFMIFYLHSINEILFKNDGG